MSSGVKKSVIKYKDQDTTISWSYSGNMTVGKRQKITWLNNITDRRKMNI